MTRLEMLLDILSEECSEVAIRCSKALRFGLDEIEPGQRHTNRERIKRELNDVHALVEMLQAVNALPAIYDPGLVIEKKRKVETFLEYSAQCGTLQETSAIAPEQGDTMATLPFTEKTQPRALERKKNALSDAQRREHSRRIDRIFQHWAKTMGKKSPKLSNDRIRLIHRALTKLGFFEEQLIQAINGCAMTPHNMGVGTGQAYNDIELILRDAAHIERFIETATREPQKGNQHVSFGQYAEEAND